MNQTSSQSATVRSSTPELHPQPWLEAHTERLEAINVTLAHFCGRLDHLSKRLLASDNSIIGNPTEKTESPDCLAKSLDKRLEDYASLVDYLGRITNSLERIA